MRIREHKDTEAAPGRAESARLRIALSALSLCLVVFVSFCFGHETLTTTVLFDREIVRILNKHCVMCHVENGPSFPLESYEQTWLQGRKIRASTIARHMPPWPAVPGYGQFANDNSLTLRETQFLTSWVEGLGPRNSGTVFTNVIDSSDKAPAAVRAKADFNHWQLGEPGVKLQTEPNTAAIDTKLTAPRRIRAIEYMPGDRRAVHAAFFTIKETGQWIGAWTPWYGFMELPAGSAFQLPAGSHIMVETRGAAADRGTLGLFFSDKPTPNTMSDLVLSTKSVPESGRFRSEITLTTETHAVAARLEMPAGVRSVEVSARKVDGSTDVLLFVKDIPPDWPTPYIFKEPVLLRRGTILAVTSYGAAVKLTLSRY
jgi:hypothetical protein